MVLITAASSGIGDATARVLARRGAPTWARRTDRLDTLVQVLRAEGGSVHARQLDVTQRDDVDAFATFALETFGRIDVIVNNAGVMPLSPLHELRLDEWTRMIDVNLRGVLHGSDAVLPHMRARKSGHSVNVSSIGGYRVSPTATVYCATKLAVNALSEGLRQENTDVRVTVISLGVVESELADSISDPGSREAMVDYRRVSIPADAIARAIAYAIEQPPR